MLDTSQFPARHVAIMEALVKRYGGYAVTIYRGENKLLGWSGGANQKVGRSFVIIDLINIIEATE